MRTIFVTVYFFLLTVNSLFAAPRDIQKYIMTDQFGYRTDDPKIAVIVDPQVGFNADDSFMPGKVYEVRRWDNDEVVFSGEPQEWNGGAIDMTSGDKGWWFNFSEVKEEGEYYIYDKENNVGSYKFLIAKDVYKQVLKAAMRVFYYQRLNDSKELPYAEEPWTDDAAFIGPNQDTEARYVNDRDNAETAKDLSGGWMDAGDSNKYITFADSPVHMLLTAFEQNPDAFTDDYNIPESGNGIPDIIDEIIYEIEWIKKMQGEDGGVIIKVGNIDWDVATPMSTDKRPRYYGDECSSSSIAFAGMLAHAAITLSQFPELGDYVVDLQKRAVNAYYWYKTNPRSQDCDPQVIKSGDADRSLIVQDEMEVISAIYLFELTGDQKYNKIVIENFHLCAPYYNDNLNFYFSHQKDALLYYTTLPNADGKTQKAILNHMSKQGNGVDYYSFRPDYDLYMAYMPLSLYTWGSNNPRAAVGSANYDYITYNIDPEMRENYLIRALGILHYFHGINPLGIVYLSNMYQYGAEYCSDEIWHDWFSNESKLDKNPAPGYVPGGPNYDYKGSQPELILQPPQKCYMNWNNSKPDNSWEITEPAIYYQASYVKLLSKFVGR